MLELILLLLVVIMAVTQPNQSFYTERRMWYIPRNKEEI